MSVGEYQGYIAARGVPAPWTVKPDDRLPVTGVQFAEALNFCAWRYPDGGRLPTEEEWEAAARGIAGRQYPWGNTWDPAAANTGSRARAPAPVGSYPRGQSPEKIDDLIGNVWEWTSSPYKPYGDSSGASGIGLYVIRGGAYNTFDRLATSTFRSGAQSAAGRENLALTGFRCAMSARQ